MNFTSGMRAPIANLTSAGTVSLRVAIEGLPNDELRVFCVHSDVHGASGLIHVDDASPVSGITTVAPPGLPVEFQLELASLPTDGTLTLCVGLTPAALAAGRRLRAAGRIEARIAGGGAECGRLDIPTSSLGEEAALRLFEVYFKAQWRIRALGDGFSGGLEALLGVHDLAGRLSELRSPPVGFDRLSELDITLAAAEVRHALADLVSRYGDAVSAGAKRCRGFLQDVCPGHPREVAVIVAALEAGVPGGVRAHPGNVFDELLLGQLQRKMASTSLLPEPAIRWACASWAAAMGLSIRVGAAPPAAPKARTQLQPGHRVPAPAAATSLTVSLDPGPPKGHLAFAALLEGGDRVGGPADVVGSSRTQTGCRALEAAEDGWTLTLSRIPDRITSVVFAVGVTSGNIGTEVTVTIGGDHAAAEGYFRASDLARYGGAALMYVYRHRTGWKLRMDGQGFADGPNGNGLAYLLTQMGIRLSDVV